MQEGNTDDEYKKIKLKKIEKEKKNRHAREK